MVLDDCRKLLVETSLQQLATLQHVVILRDTATIDQALKTLAARKILSAPVVLGDGDDNAVHWPASEGAVDILGFVDVRDVLHNFLQGLDVAEVADMKLLQRMRHLEEKGAAFAKTPLREMPIFGGDGDFLHTTQARVSLLELITYTILNPQRRGLHAGSRMPSVVHRVAIFDSAARITNIISQTDLVRFLHRHSHQLKPLVQRAVADLGLVSNAVRTTTPTTPAIAALAAMAEAAVSALAVVDEGGAIIGNFSVSDMRTIVAEQFGALALPVGEFLAHEHGTEYWGTARVSGSGGNGADARDEAAAAPAPSGSAEGKDEGVAAAAAASTAFQFAADHSARQRPRTAGEEVGQDLVLCSGAATLAEVMGMLVKHRVHRVYVVDAGRKPVGIITCTDVLRCITDAVRA